MYTYELKFAIVSGMAFSSKGTGKERGGVQGNFYDSKSEILSACVFSQLWLDTPRDGRDKWWTPETWTSHFITDPV